jgi:alkylated DNA nucleotide flippase Atl1
VSVAAQQGDNAHRIFESLNNTGLRLTQGDLLRNYLFMRLPTRREAAYQSLWMPLQSQLGSADLELLFWLDLVHRDPRVKQADTYTAQQARLDRLTTEPEIEAELARFARLGRLLKLILQPADEPDPQVRRRLERLNAWGTTTVYPLLLHLLDRRDQGTATSEQIAAAMLNVESFFVRRLLIGRATANINRILLGVVTEMNKELPVDEAVRAYLSTGRKYYATDAELRSALRTIPFYLNGRVTQRFLVLRWLEESYGSKEPLAFAGLTIEHALPQTLTPDWRRALGEDLQPDENLGQVHEGLLHTLGNLTLTGYNSKLSNSSFALKRPQLAKSGLSMNQDIAELPRWGRPEIYARADQLAERVISIWPGPSDVATGTDSGVAWDVMAKALAELPAGSWTTYGDLAALIGSHPVPVGMRLATVPVVNAHRVLQAEGTISPGFRWPDPARTEDPRDLLAQEGVQFDERGYANPAQRISTEELAQLAGVTVDDLSETVPDPNPGQDPALRDRFVEQLAELQTPSTVHGVLALLDAWTAMGGRVQYGTAGETSCFLMARTSDHPSGSIWPAALYPSGKCEVVFQHLANRPPFDDLELREEFRQRLNQVPGVDLPAAKIELRPGFDLAVLAEAAGRESLITELSWFLKQAGDYRAADEPLG